MSVSRYYTIFRSTLLVPALLLCGCVHQAIDLHDNAAPVDIPSQWSSDNNGKEPIWPDNDWWKQLGSPELTNLVNQGRSNNLEIAAAIARVHQAESSARIAGASLLPNVDLNAGNNRNWANAQGGGTYSSASANLSVGYEVDFWGKNKASLAAAQASLQANRFDRETVALTVTSGIVSTYLQVLSLRDQLVIARQNVDSAERVLELVEAQNRAGSASILDLARQRSTVAGQKAMIPSLVQQEREATTALAILLGKAPQSFTVKEQGLGKILLPKVKPGLPSELLSRRPDIRHAEANLLAAKANVDVAHAALFPSISLSGSTGAQSSALLWLFNSPGLLVNIGANLVTPIFDAGRLDNAQQLAVAQKQELLQVYRATVIGAFAEVDVALGQISNLEEQSQLKKAEMEQAKLAFDLSEIRYRAGAEDLMTVIDTQRTLSEVQNELGQLKLKRLKATVTLYKTLGGGWQDHAS